MADRTGPNTRPVRVVVMGVSGSGKSTVGVELADRLRAVYVEADDAHPPANIDKMSAGIPLTDADRRPWLDRLAAELTRHDRVVVSCSALKRTYRERLRHVGDVCFVYLAVPAPVAIERLEQRADHFMGPEMVTSQFDTLEPPDADELDVVTVDATRPIDVVVETAERLVRAAAVTFDVVDPRDADAIAAMSAYFDELEARFGDGFDPGDTLVADAPSMRAPRGTFVVAHAAAVPIACGGVVGHDATTGEIKRMWVSADWRGAGLGRRMLAVLEGHVERLGYSRVVLDTNAVLTEAIALYERAGYVPIEPYNDNPYAMRWFEKRLG